MAQAYQKMQNTLTNLEDAEHFDQFGRKDETENLKQEKKKNQYG